MEPPVVEAERRRREAIRNAALERAAEAAREAERAERRAEAARDAQRAAQSVPAQSNASVGGLRQRLFGTRGSEPPQQPPEPETPATCRICHGGEEDGLGRLFSPCQCSGTVGKVHLQCLNAWRNMSTNPHSFYQCETCGYRYNLQRASFATYLEDTRLVNAVAVLLLVLIIAATAAAYLVGGEPGDLAGRFYRLVQWFPGWRWWTWSAQRRWGGRLDSLVVGSVAVGLAGFLGNVGHQMREDREYFTKYILPALVLFGAQHGTPALRVFVVLGMIVAYQALYHRLWSLSKHILMKFGEIVLEVS